MTKKDRKKFKKNIFQLIFGLILLGFSGGYLHQHQAEAKSIWSGFDTLFEKATISRNRLTNKDNVEALEKKFKLEKYLEDVLATLEGRDCLSSQEQGEIRKFYDRIKNSSDENLKENLDNYFQKTYSIDTLIKQSCK